VCSNNVFGLSMHMCVCMLRQKHSLTGLPSTFCCLGYCKFDCQYMRAEDCMETSAKSEISATTQGGHKTGNHGILRDFSEHGNSGNSVQPQG